MTNARRTAAFVVARWLLTKEFPANLLPDGPDRAFVQDLVYTVIRRLRPLRHILGAFVKQWPKGELEALLYVGAAQVLYMDDVPDFAAVNETVSAAKACENPSIARVVNGVLRNLIRQRASVSLGTELETFPTALVRRWTARFGAANAERLAAWHNAPAVTYLARKDGTFTQLERGQKVSDVPGFATGDFIVQDPGTHLAVALLDPQPGERILDACAAPGGKTVQLAWRGADVTACEINPRRRARLEENLRRLKLADVKVVGDLRDVRDKRLNSQTFDYSTIRPFDHFPKVLVDAPCSNTGVFRRRRMSRWAARSSIRRARTSRRKTANRSRHSWRATPTSRCVRRRSPCRSRRDTTGLSPPRSSGRTVPRDLKPQKGRFVLDAAKYSMINYLT